MQQSQTSSKRADWLDSVAGLLIIHMIFTHCLQWSKYDNHLLNEITSWLFFFMPWFFFKSGVFYKSIKTRSYIEKQVKKLLIPYVVFSAIGFLIGTIIMILQGETNLISIIRPLGKIVTVGATDGNLALWFLLSLFGVQMLYNQYDHKCSSSNKDLYLLLVSISISCLLNYVGFSKPYYVTNIIAGLVFFTAGRLMKNFQYNKYVAISASMLFIVIMTTNRSIVGMWSNTLVEGNYLLWIISSVCGCVAIDNLFKLIGGGRISFLKSIGIQSMNYYVIHWMVIEIVYALAIIFTDNQLTILVVLVISCVILLPVANFYIVKNDIINDATTKIYEKAFNNHMGRKC